MSLMVPGGKSPHYATPAAVLASLESEFGPLFDVCPLGSTGPADPPWPVRVYMNPPYGRGVINSWVQMAIAHGRSGGLVVCLLPSYTGSPWWHDLVIPNATEIRFLRGKLRFGDNTGVAPFWSAVVIFGRSKP